jgi:hypothetical protein
MWLAKTLRLLAACENTDDRGVDGRESGSHFDGKIAVAGSPSAVVAALRA